MKRYLTIFSSILLTTAISYAGTDGIESRTSLLSRTMGNTHFVKSGSPFLIKMLNNLSTEGDIFRAVYKTAGRPSKDAYADSDKGHFRVHYDTTGVNAPDLTDADKNGVPDYVDSALVYLEYAWDKIIALGYGTPKKDNQRGGSNAVDCYIEELSNQQMYGYTGYDSDNGIAGMYSAYITIDNNFTDTVYPTVGNDALRTTTAHEYFHVIHLSYFGGDTVIWWMEQSAVWFEDYVWDDVNDYIYYLYAFMEDREKPIDTHNNVFEYGAALFAFYIAENYGVDMIRYLWNAFKDNQAGNIEIMDSVLPEGLAQTLSDFAVWLYFTDYRANTGDFFSESYLIRETVTPELFISSVTSTDTLKFRHYTFKYVDIIPEKGLAPGDTLYCDFVNISNGTWKDQVILYNSPADYSIEPLNWQQPSIPIKKSYDQAILIITNTSEEASVFSRSIAINITSTQNVEEKPVPESFVLHPNYPNPFNPSTTITYTLPAQSQVLLRVVNMQGQTIGTLEDRVVQQGTHSLVFEGSGLPSGIYFLHLTAGDSYLTQKITLLK
ncbi:MAG: T9SS type A sorting domain-containing protein [Candidatus Latescibacteria bacterium]|nr:T9SS type A sorting domain-containing protein [Candidatus Latescibacterota bacterium]